MKPDFENWLMEYWAEHDRYGVLDDDMPDAFSDWLENSDPTELIELANKYIAKNYVPKDSANELFLALVEINNVCDRKHPYITSACKYATINEVVKSALSKFNGESE